MAEMTASEAKEILLNLSWMVGTERRSQIAAIIEQQAQEIAKKDRMLEITLTALSNRNVCAIGEGMPDDMQDCDNSGGNFSCTACWLAWLEKEAEVQG